ncbi:MAG TPA: hypothetical protein VGH47_08225, partial [Xanthobacteraceae bacterium]
ECDDATLGGRINCFAAAADTAGIARNINDLAFSGCDHGRQQRLREMHWTAEIDSDDAVHVVGRIVDERLEVIPTCRVDQQVDTTAASDYFRSAASRRFRIGQIDRNGLNRKPRIGGLFGDLRCFGTVDIGANDARPATGKFQDRRFADTGSTSRDQRCFAVKLHGSGPFRCLDIGING